MKDTNFNRQSVDLYLEATAKVRLIIQRPDNNQVLMVRYEAAVDDVEDEVDADDSAANTRKIHTRRQMLSSLPSYWSFKGLVTDGPIGRESSMTEVVVRTAYQKLGILIEDLERILVLYDRRRGQDRIGRLYYLVREWTGAVPFKNDCEPPPQSFPKNTKRDCTNRLEIDVNHLWVAPQFLGHFLSHPEVTGANQVWREWEKKHKKGAGV